MESVNEAALLLGFQLHPTHAEAGEDHSADEPGGGQTATVRLALRTLHSALRTRCHSTD